jgi:Tfp pilus assembly protein PilX
MTTVRGEQGSVLIIAVIAMLIMGVLSVSFALLANVETKIGLNQKLQGQAEALAEAGLDRARDAIRPAATLNSFTSFLGSPNFLWNGTNLGGGQYFARIDNDCPPLVPNIATIADPNCGSSPGTDGNETAVITAWATAGAGRARVRAVVAIDNAWKHVCASTTQEDFCNDPDNTNGNPTIQPGDPNDENGPAIFDDLPRPILGCSRVDPLLHKVDRSLNTQHDQCAAQSSMYQYPYPPHLNPGNPRFVVMGADPAVVTGAPHCNEPVPGGEPYFGYFDCALTTPCPVGFASCNGGAGRDACVRETDSRAGTPGYSGRVFDPGVPAWRCPVGATGMVFDGPTNFAGGGSLTDRRTMYVLNGRFEMQSATFFGTVVVEGDENTATLPAGCSAAQDDVQMKSGAVIWTGPNSGTGPGTGVQAYGYPLALLIYNPDLTPPTPAASQPTCGDMGSGSGTAIHGMIYSAGRMEFNPFEIDGSVVAFDLHAQGSSSEYQYNYKYGVDGPPPGFDTTNGNMVVVYRKSFIICSNYSDESGGATACP